MVEKQALFLKTISEFILKANEEGYQLTAGEAERPPSVAQYYASVGKGIKNSLHISRLAFDLNAFLHGEYLDGSQRWHIPHLEKLGEMWEAMNPMCAWGGRFSGKTAKDYNHYSFEHNGVK
jgi:hypothetical protein